MMIDEDVERSCKQNNIASFLDIQQVLIPVLTTMVPSSRRLLATAAALTMLLLRLAPQQRLAGQPSQQEIK